MLLFMLLPHLKDLASIWVTSVKILTYIKYVIGKFVKVSSTLKHIGE